jgi:hypothetical protein
LFYSWEDLLSKLLSSLTWWQFPVPAMCADFYETSYPSNSPTESNRKALISVRLVAINTLLQIAQNTCSTEFSFQKRHE